MPDGDSDNQAVHPETVQFAASLPLAIRELLDADRTAAIVLGLDGEVLSANETALELLGAESVAAMTVGSASHAILRSMLDHAPRRLVNGSTDGIWQGDIDYIDPTGEHRIFRATLATRHDSAFAGGGFIGMVAHDVTISRSTARTCATGPRTTRSRGSPTAARSSRHSPMHWRINADDRATWPRSSSISTG